MAIAPLVKETCVVLDTAVPATPALHATVWKSQTSNIQQQQQQNEVTLATISLITRTANTWRGRIGRIAEQAVSHSVRTGLGVAAASCWVVSVLLWNGLGKNIAKATSGHRWVVVSEGSVVVADRWVGNERVDSRVVVTRRRVPRFSAVVHFG